MVFHQYSIGTSATINTDSLLHEVEEKGARWVAGLLNSLPSLKSTQLQERSNNSVLWCRKESRVLHLAFSRYTHLMFCLRCLSCAEFLFQLPFKCIMMLPRALALNGHTCVPQNVSNNNLIIAVIIM